MNLRFINLVQFKNHLQTRWSIDGRILVITGKNGAGKTNLLDAIHLLCLGKSYFSGQDVSQTMWGKDFYRIEGIFESERGREKVVVKTDGKSKKIELDDLAYKTIADHVGKFPCTVIAPQDISMVSGLSELRRKFLDVSISQTNPDYLRTLMHYNQVLKQRNALLKKGTGFQSDVILNGFDQTMVPLAESIFRARTYFFEEFQPVFSSIHAELSGGADRLTLRYDSVLQKRPFEQVLSQARSHDKLLQRSTQGIHRDDFRMELGEAPLHKSGSQGQIKTAVFALKMAQYHFLTRQLKTKPILLLDDVFDKLDPQRIAYLFELLRDAGQYGQIFITDTYPERLKDMMVERAIPDVHFSGISELMAG
jgi:DNA replication and repair protein RecF